jgi:hypothetical protein
MKLRRVNAFSVAQKPMKLRHMAAFSVAQTL